MSDDLRQLRNSASEAADFAQKAPGLVETNGHVIADLYRAIARLADLLIED